MDALIVVDVQNDFCEGGALEVPNGDEVVTIINPLMQEFNCVVFTQDWHPRGHNSFASSHENQRPFDVISVDYGDQVLWPDHCIQGTEGAEFHPELEVNHADTIIRKGYNRDIDSYSGFYENDGETSTGLAGYLGGRDVDTVYIVGLATEFCVKWTALDAVEEGFETHVIQEAVRGIHQQESRTEVWSELKNNGVKRSLLGDVFPTDKSRQYVRFTR